MTIKSFAMLARMNEFKTAIDHTLCTDAHGDMQNVEDSLDKLAELFLENRNHGGSIYLVGNGGSAAVTSHAITDFINVCRLRAFTLHESSLMTCMTNDFGYEQAYARILNTVMRPNDMLIAISSSGASPNICNAVKMAKECHGSIITFSGFKHDNPLRQSGDLNFWLDSSDYGIVEISHLFILHNISDRLNMKLKQSESIIAMTEAG